ncbi:PstS family phosphate ABC transporter substrate-binding protein [Nocardioides pelophilus]|uniref:PstS family phosphate ABC transporter substrate-binding protein n=1 Tax=Nocardioides pelophilus TaxID=2172019 RepID=UPI0015FEBCEB|nr:PstS family phosphate ABC transporter substrate-binding protein [Nocardioides pelophilus]
MNVTPIRRALVPGLAALALVLTACGSDDSDGNGNGGTGDGNGLDTSVTGEVIVDGSSTVYPMTSTAGQLMKAEGSSIEVSVGESGTGGGFEKFCVGDTDISDASRPIKDDEEVPVCEENGIEFTELLVATDALTVAVHPDLAVDCLTVDELVALFGPKSTATNWQDINPDFPDEKITGFIPGTDSGTYDYMAADVVGDESETLRNDFESSEDDNVLVQGISGTEGAVGFFGYSYYEENADTLKAVAIDSGAGCVEPSAETAQDGTYTPLARPLFIYVNNKSYTEEPAVAEFTDYYIANLADIAEGALFIPLNDEDYAATQEALAGISG